ncbi:MAG: hypothetical protein WCG60_00350 [bacterium]
MNKMLSDALREYHGLREQLDRALLGDKAKKWGKAFATFMRGEPTWVEGMIYAPLEWSRDLGEVPVDLIKNTIRLFGKEYADGGIGWRLPKVGEVYRSLKRTGHSGFVLGRLFWASNSESDGGGILIIDTLDGKQVGILNSSDYSLEKEVHLRLVREMPVEFG